MSRSRQSRPAFRRCLVALLMLPLAGLLIGAPASAFGATGSHFSLHGVVVTGEEEHSEGCLLTDTFVQAGAQKTGGAVQAFYFQSVFNQCTGQTVSNIEATGTATTFKVGGNLVSAHLVATVTSDAGEQVHLDYTWTATGAPVHMFSNTVFNQPHLLLQVQVDHSIGRTAIATPATVTDATPVLGGRADPFDFTFIFRGGSVTTTVGH